MKCGPTPAWSAEEIQQDAFRWHVRARREGSDLVLHWRSFHGADSVFVFRDTVAYYDPDVSGYKNRVASLPSTATTYASSYGVGDPDAHAFYRLVAHSKAFGGIRYSRTVGEFEF
jgi:hypothetical protein